MEVVDLVVARDFFVLCCVEDGKGGAGVCDHGRGTAEIVHADGEYLGVMLPDAWVVALQLDELPEAYPSEESAIEDEDDVLVALEVGECDVDAPVGDWQAEVGRGIAGFGWCGTTCDRDARYERGCKCDQQSPSLNAAEGTID